MTYQVLARKWRPKRFQDVIGQKHVTVSLQNAIQRGSIGHAYLLTGTRGIGKTTVARLFAKALRCLNLTDDGNPCEKCECCQDFETGTSMNIMEIDGASNNGVDNVRELIGNIQYFPTIGKYKVYIIDEVHMLSTNAFNALLKTLEEPPAHVIFIIATTEPQKLLGTVLSRCIRFDLRNVSLNELQNHIQKIAKVEGISFQNELLLQQICRQGKGSVRDTLSLLDQVLSFCQDGKIGEEEVVLSLGIARLSAIRELTEMIFTGDSRAVSRLVLSLLAENTPPQNIALALTEHLYDVINHLDQPEQLKSRQLLDPELLNDYTTAEIFWIFESLSKEINWVLGSIDPEKTLEILLQKLSLRREFFEVTASPQVKKKIISAPIVEKIQEAVRPQETQKEVKVEVKAPHTWEGFLDHVSKIAQATANNLEQGNLLSVINTKGTHINISLGFEKGNSVFFDHLNDPETKSRIEDYLASYFEREKSQIHLDLTVVGKDVEGFVSVAEKKTLDEEEENARRTREFVNQPLFQEAKKIFNSDFDKIVLNKK